MKSSIYKRKDGRWEGYVIYVDPDTAEEDKKSFYAPKRPEVKRKLDDFIRKYEEGDYSDIRKVTIRGWLKKFIEVYCANLAQTTLDGYNRYIDKHIIPEIGDLKLKELKPLHIQKFYNTEREKGYKDKTILQEHRILHRAFKKAVVDGMISRNPCDGVDAPSPENYEPTIYTEAEFVLLLEKLKGHRMEAVILLAGMCGLRRGELMGLTWEDIDLDNAVIDIARNTVPTSQGTITTKTKTIKSTRVFSIPSTIIPILKRIRGIGKIYTKLDGGEYNPGSVSRTFKEFLKDNKLKHIRLHDLRHFNATMMLKHGVTEREAQERLGHSNAKMTQQYQHILKDMDKKSANKLNNVLKTKGKKTVKSAVKS